MGEDVSRQWIMSFAEYDDLSRLSYLTTAQVKALWDQYDGDNSPDGISGEMIHLVLNMRGEGEYCSV